jgi:hypothetical protein
LFFIHDTFSFDKSKADSICDFLFKHFPKLETIYTGLACYEVSGFRDISLISHSSIQDLSYFISKLSEMYNCQLWSRYMGGNGFRQADNSDRNPQFDILTGRYDTIVFLIGFGEGGETYPRDMDRSHTYIVSNNLDTTEINYLGYALVTHS